LFNWLMPKLPQSSVLDLFAGSGALGLEAVSRGASHATLIEQDPVLVQRLRQTAQRLSAQSIVRIVHEDARQWLARQPGGLADIAFVDPPFSADLWEQTLALLLPRLNPGAWLYLEHPIDTAPELSLDWPLHREGRTREVRFALYRGPEG
jgi:16S rRNA (guanine966-N2)-methyltransferase